MNILGAGPAELVMVLVIMLIIAGPKRMIRWAYVLGQYTSQLREMFQQAVTAFQKELADANLDLPKDLNIIPKGKFDIFGEATNITNPPVTLNNDKPADAPTNTDEEHKQYDSWLLN